LSTGFLRPNFLIAIAASPPEEVTLPAISAAVVRHTGHMGFSFFAIRRSRDGLLSAGLGWLAKTPRAMGVAPGLCRLRFRLEY
jgi:hypothetical protein